MSWCVGREGGHFPVSPCSGTLQYSPSSSEATRAVRTPPELPLAVWCGFAQYMMGTVVRDADEQAKTKEMIPDDPVRLGDPVRKG